MNRRGRKYKRDMRFLQSLLADGSALNDRPGRLLHQTYPKPNRKARRHSGRKTVFYDDKDYPYMETFWDNWGDYRDGQRDGTRVGKYYHDDGELAGMKEIKMKIKKQYKIRKERCLQASRV